MQVRLFSTPSAQGDAYRTYKLKVIEDDDTEREIFVADLSKMGGGISLERWKVKTKNGRRVLSVYLEVSIMGHDLDQWKHYDLDTDEELS